MTTERDPRTRVVLSWLREDAHENAERVLLRALDEVDTTPQRRPVWPARRSPRMRISMKLVAAAAAVLAVAIAGWRLLPTIEVSTQPTQSPNPSGGLASPTSPSSESTPGPTVPPPSRTVSIGAPFELPLEVTVPADWVPNTQAAGQFDFSGPEGAPYVGFFLVDGVYKDPCRPELGVQDRRFLGQYLAPDEILLDFDSYPAGFQTSERSHVIVAGHDAEHAKLDVSVRPATSDCPSEPMIPLFVARGEDVSTTGGTRLEFWSLWTDPTRHLLVAAELSRDQLPRDQRLVEAILESIRVTSTAGAPTETSPIVGGTQILSSADFREFVSVQVPSDWSVLASTRDDFTVGFGSFGDRVGFYAASGVYADPCDSGVIRQPRSGPPTVEQIETWLGRIDGYDAGDPSPTSIGGRSARELTLTPNASLPEACQARPVPFLSVDDGRAASFQAGAQLHVWIVEPIGPDGTPYVVMTTDIGAGLGHSHPEKVAAIIKTIRFPG